MRPPSSPFSLPSLAPPLISSYLLSAFSSSFALFTSSASSFFSFRSTFSSSSFSSKLFLLILPLVFLLCRLLLLLFLFLLLLLLNSSYLSISPSFFSSQLFLLLLLFVLRLLSVLHYNFKQNKAHNTKARTEELVSDKAQADNVARWREGGGRKAQTFEKLSTVNKKRLTSSVTQPATLTKF
jgi:hypothetical protein